ncbi:VIT1/CCC1 family predicted Fe2+/Mn2+ transporter [Thiogranum longum]|uniref:VIT1/CCC1 family predicted Fe2+/Mn2+ transporter n=1 Tax=Thiogranum longum TaxID=1537524 RepID=A0A4R1HDL8_9GAMM|nr:VIT1/CCC1 transporter family protein [Thiogranum longum]TCK17389.1 VIT1/CCC1 family predicted Fe2+/Mn2+ transporter [Thiogranum longum]
MNTTFCAQARHFYLDEMNDHITYRTLAGGVRDPHLAQLLQRVADTELHHANFWAGLLRQHDQLVPKVQPKRLRLWVLQLLLRLVGPVWLVSALELGETGAAHTYYRVWNEGVLNDEERNSLRDIIIDELEHESSFREEQNASALGNVRDFVLGMNDGLVEILGTVTGLSAAYAGNLLLVAVSGLVVGVAGALSMGIGAFISVRSQRQINESTRARMEILFAVSPQRAVEEYRERLQGSGLPEDISVEVAERLGTQQDVLTKLLFQDSPENEWRSAFFTGGAYLFGVAFPVLPYFLADSSQQAVLGSIGFAGLALALVGAMIALVSGISLRGKIMEMVVSGFSAAGLAYLFGYIMQALFGVGV